MVVRSCGGRGAAGPGAGRGTSIVAQPLPSTPHDDGTAHPDAHASDAVAPHADGPYALPRRRRWPRILGVVLLIAALLLVVGGAVYVTPQPLLPEATAALASTTT